MTKESKQQLIDLYRMMLEIRLCEESFVAPINTREILCPVHLYTGQEAVAAGICCHLNPDDYIFSNHRSHGHYLAKGGDLKKLIAEVYCKEKGCSRGRGGSMHVYDLEAGMMGSAPIVAGTISLALGAALASRIRKDNRVSITFLGDGATGEGVLYESLNYAALKKLPIIFVCENNYYSTHLPISEIRVSDQIYKVAQPFGVKTHRVDGNDVLAVSDVAREAVSLCREGQGPVFIEAMTYRMRGHVGPDDNIQGTHTDIRPKEEIEQWRLKDPLTRFEKYLVENNVCTQAYLSDIQECLQKEIEEAHHEACQDAFPDSKEIAKYVFRENT
ncbi:MAG: thiamine pyrophosphate-dependent dehydrogenase E1 component subunit alpha [bacterium]|nr:thiamine pyrophosphate-dependent dehydrogenase E1 component subunit alpha [bacterium]